MILLFTAEVRVKMRISRERLVLALDLIAEDVCCGAFPRASVSLALAAAFSRLSTTQVFFFFSILGIFV
jgi:hypothetical protein